MARCPSCGKNNKDGSLFCQDCGQKLEDAGAAVKPRPAAATGASAPVATAPCSQCGTVNPPGMNFCKMCGTALVSGATPTTVSKAAPVASAVPSAVSAMGTAGKLTCPACNKLTPSGFAFCQHCGARLGAKAGTAEALAATMAPAAGVTPTPPAGIRPTGGLGAYAPTMSPASSAVAAALATAARAAESGALHGRLVVLRRDGTDGESHELAGASVDVGREGGLAFSEDPFLAARHARLSGSPEGLRVRPLDTVNGVFLRLREAVELSAGDHLLLGKELLRFESVTPEERDPPQLVEHGVRLLGSTQRESWGRLRELTASGTTRNVWHLTRPEFVLGREEGDVVFPDDEFMSRRHAALRRAGATGKARLEDMGSSNGTFLRLRGEHTLRSGDVLRMGDQLLRFED